MGCQQTSILGKFSNINWADDVNWPPLVVSKLTFRALALRHLIWSKLQLWNFYGGQFTLLSGQLILLNYLFILFHRRSTTVSLETYPPYSTSILTRRARRPFLIPIALKYSSLLWLLYQFFIFPYCISSGFHNVFLMYFKLTWIWMHIVRLKSTQKARVASSYASVRTNS